MWYAEGESMSNSEVRGVARPQRVEVVRQANLTTAKNEKMKIEITKSRNHNWINSIERQIAASKFDVPIHLGGLAVELGELNLWSGRGVRNRYLFNTK